MIREKSFPSDAKVVIVPGWRGTENRQTPLGSYPGEEKYNLNLEDLKVNLMMTNTMSNII